MSLLNRHELGIDRDEQVAKPCGEGVYRSQRAAVETDSTDHAGAAASATLTLFFVRYLMESPEAPRR